MKKIFSFPLLITIVLVFVFAVQLQAQTSNKDHTYKEVTLTIKQSLRIPQHLVVIHLAHYTDETQISIQSVPMKGHEKEWLHTQIDTTYSIDAAVFEDITSMIETIDPNDINYAIKNYSNGRDGKMCTLAFGDYQNAISYKIWSPNTLTSQRKLDDFLFICKKIIQLGGFKISDIL